MAQTYLQEQENSAHNSDRVKKCNTVELKLGCLKQNSSSSRSSQLLSANLNPHRFNCIFDEILVASKLEHWLTLFTRYLCGV